MTSAGLMVLLMMICGGCASSRVRVISEDRIVLRVLAGQAVTPKVDGWFVPDARWIEMREAVADRILELEQKK